MEVSQFTYFQQVGGIDLSPVSAELTWSGTPDHVPARKDSVYDISGTSMTYARSTIRMKSSSLAIILMRVTPPCTVSTSTSLRPNAFVSPDRDCFGPRMIIV
ncbi:MAG: glycine--tRNA ligase subunit alpha [Bilophila wadsworthia]